MIGIQIVARITGYSLFFLYAKEETHAAMTGGVDTRAETCGCDSHSVTVGAPHPTLEDEFRLAHTNPLS